MSKLDEQRRHVEAAIACFTKAAAALHEWPIEKNALPFALLEASIGLSELAHADIDEKAKEQVMELLEAKKAACEGMARGGRR